MKPPKRGTSQRAANDGSVVSENDRALALCSPSQLAFASRKRAKIADNSVSHACPARVSSKPRPVRRNSNTPSSSSSCLIWWLTAVCVTRSSAPALGKAAEARRYLEHMQRVQRRQRRSFLGKIGGARARHEKYSCTMPKMRWSAAGAELADKA